MLECLLPFNDRLCFLNLFQLQPENAPPQIEEKVCCLCQQPNTNQPYAECSKCKDWFHHLCVGERSIEDIQLISLWLCPKCSSETPKQLKKKKTPRQLFAPREIAKTHCFLLTRAEWEAIGPADTKGHRGGKLRSTWCDIFSRKIASICNCVLIFKKKNLHKSGNLTEVYRSLLERHTVNFQCVGDLKGL